MYRLKYQTVHKIKGFLIGWKKCVLCRHVVRSINQTSECPD